MLNIIALSIFLVSLCGTYLWRSTFNKTMLTNVSEKGKSLYYKTTRLLSVCFISIGAVFVSMNGGLWVFGVWDFLFYFFCIPVLTLLIKSLIVKRSPFDVYLTTKRWLDLFLREIPLTYIYVIIWIKLILIGMYSSITF